MNTYRRRAGRRWAVLGRGRALSKRRKRYLTDVDRRGFTDSDGVRIAWYEYGPEDAETTVVLIHGYTLAAESFHLQTEYLRKRWPGVRLLLMDLRGHGMSDKPSAAQCSVDAAAHDVLRVLAERVHTGRVIVLGHSLGGPVSLAVLRRAPQGLYDRVAGVIQVSSAIEELAAAGLARILNTKIAHLVFDFLHSKPRGAWRLRERIAGLIAPVLAIGFFMRETDDELIEFHAALINETPTRTLVGFFDDLRVHQELAAAPRLQRLPGFVLVGQKDLVTPIAQSERIGREWPKAWRQMAHGAGHMLPLEAPKSVNAAVDRLLRHLAGAPGT